MFKAMPSFNKIIAKKWEEQNLKAHEERVKDAKSGIRILDPVVYGCGKSKKQQIEDEKWMKINRENGILHGKLDLIEKKLLQTPKISKSVSLNKVFIKEQQRLIVAANAQMQNRIEKASSSYSLNKLLKDRERTEKTLKNLCEFPYTLGKHHTSTPKISTSSSVISLFEKKVAVSGKNFIARVQKSNKYLLIKCENLQSRDYYNLKVLAKNVKHIIGKKKRYGRLLKMLEYKEGELLLAVSHEKKKKTLL